MRRFKPGNAATFPIEGEFAVSRLEDHGSARHEVSSSECLRSRLDVMAKENLLLRSELNTERRKTKMMVDALVLARHTIVSQINQPGSSGKIRGAAFVKLHGSIKGVFRSLMQSHLGKKEATYIPRAALEALLLISARKNLKQIQRIFIEFDTHSFDAPGPNWRVSGVTSGKADPVEALAAARAAADRHRTLIMIEDETPLRGRMPAKLSRVARYRKKSRRLV